MLGANVWLVEIVQSIKSRWLCDDSHSRTDQI